MVRWFVAGLLETRRGRVDVLDWGGSQDRSSRYLYARRWVQVIMGRVNRSHPEQNPNTFPQALVL